MTVKDAKEVCATYATPTLLAMYRNEKRRQGRMGLSACTASCRVTDKLAAELRKRGVTAEEMKV